MSARDLCQIAYLPYAPISRGFSVGDYQIWPYHRECRSRITDKRLRQELSKLFACYHERKYDPKTGGYDRPVEEIFVVSPVISPDGTSSVNEQQVEDIRSIAHIIAFCAINEPDIVKWTSDAFVLHTYSFRPDSEGFRLYQTMFTNIEMIKFLKPYHLPAPLTKFEKTDMCDALGKTLGQREREDIRRLLRTLELFYHTATYSEMMTDEHRVLFLVMCFEVLLDFGGKKRKLADKIEQEITNNSPQKETRVVKEGQGTTEIEHSQTGWWAYDLYDLRSDIIHGKAVDWKLQKYGNVWTQIDFGGVLLRKLVKRVLAKQNLWFPGSDEGVLRDHILEDHALDDLLARKVRAFQEHSRI